MRTATMPSCIVLLFCSSFLAAIVSQVDARSTLLTKLLERQIAKDAYGRHYRQAEDNIKRQSGQRPSMDNPNAKKFLERFGYLQQLPPGTSHDYASVREAIRKFQKMYHVKETGELDAETLEAMKAPRCGMGDTKPTVYTQPDSTDIQKRFFTPGYKWRKTDLTYRFRNFASTTSLSQDTQRRAIERAFRMWSDVTPLTFRETADPRGDLNLEFAVAAHSDGAQNAFDGPGGVLAHAFYPESGETHFDDHEAWVDRKTEGIDLMTVAAHELGHALGLGHSSVGGALMAPYYQGYDPDFVLTDDDIAAIQSLYGVKQNGGVQPQKTQKPTLAPSTTTTTTTTTTVAPMVTRPDGQPDTCSVTFRAITQIHDNSIFVFNGPWLWRITDEGLENGYPIRTRELYQSAPVNVDAAVYSRTTYYTFLFFGKTVWQYHGFDLISTRNIATQSFPGSISDVITNANGNIFLIRGAECWMFMENDLSVMPPSRPCSQIFPNLDTTFDSAVQLVNEPQFIYTFKGKNYSKYNIATRRLERGYPKAKAGPWMGAACGGARYSPK